MKTISIILLAFLLSSFSADLPIYGKWELVHVEEDGKDMNVKKDTYFVTFKENEIEFNRALNSCTVKANINDLTIVSSAPECTEVCCDEEADPISATFDYQGEYRIEGSTLTINSSKYKYVLIRVME